MFKLTRMYPYAVQGLLINSIFDPDSLILKFNYLLDINLEINVGGISINNSYKVATEVFIGDGNDLPMNIPGREIHGLKKKTLKIDIYPKNIIGGIESIPGSESSRIRFIANGTLRAQGEQINVTITREKNYGQFCESSESNFNKISSSSNAANLLFDTWFFELTSDTNTNTNTDDNDDDWKNMKLRQVSVPSSCKESEEGYGDIRKKEFEEKYKPLGLKEAENYFKKKMIVKDSDSEEEESDFKKGKGNRPAFRDYLRTKVFEFLNQTNVIQPVDLQGKNLEESVYY